MAEIGIRPGLQTVCDGGGRGEPGTNRAVKGDGNFVANFSCLTVGGECFDFGVACGTGRQYFRDIPMKKWTSNRYGTNANPITNTSRFYSYDPWQPWFTSGISYTTSVDSDGTLVIRSEVADPRDDQPPVTVARVAASGTQAVLQDRNRADKALSTTTITFTAVPDIAFPPRK